MRILIFMCTPPEITYIPWRIMAPFGEETYRIYIFM